MKSFNLGRWCGRGSVVVGAIFLAACGPAVTNTGGSGGTGGGGGTTPSPSPSVFAFTDVSGVALSTTITSDNVTIGGLSALATISVTGGQYQVGSNNWSAQPGQIANAQTVRVKHTSASTNSGDVVTTLTIGAVSASFKSTTVASGGIPVITQNALQWTQDNINPATTWQTADSYCSGTTINGRTGWRLPTVAELTALRTSNNGVNLGWAMSGIWASDLLQQGFHYYVPMATTNSTPASYPDAGPINFTCVHL